MIVTVPEPTVTVAVALVTVAVVTEGVLVAGGGVVRVVPGAMVAGPVRVTVCVDPGTV